MLYAVGLGIGLGLLLRGHLHGLAAIRFRWSGLALGGMLVQLALFSASVAAAIGDFGAPIYVTSSAIVLVAVLRNAAIRGLSIVALGATSNLAAIIANGGWMPTSAAALAGLGQTLGAEYSNSRLVVSPALAPLTDVMAMPRWLPFANVFSVGDVLIGIGIAVAIVVAMRKARAAQPMAPVVPALAAR